MKINNSIEAYEEAKRVIPGGVDSPVRAFKSVGGTPLFIQKGEGVYLYDIDGNRYVDLFKAGDLWCLVIVIRYRNSSTKSGKKRTKFWKLPSTLETDLAKKICELFEFDGLD